MGQGTDGMQDETDLEIAEMMRREAMEEKRRYYSKPQVDKREMQTHYNVAVASNIGDTIKCPACGKEHIKTTHHKVFCSNHKTAGNRNCKDRYWNIVDESRAIRASTYYK